MRKLVLPALLLAAIGCGDDNNETPDAAHGQPDAGTVFEDVTLDPANTTGFQFETPKIQIDEGVEEQDCYFVEMPDLAAGQDYWIDHIRIGVNPGSHHANIFRVATPVNLIGANGDVVKNGECFKSSNWADWPLVANNQNSSADNPYLDWQLPDGVAFKFSPHELLMVQTHYVNASTQETPFQSKVVVDFYKSAIANPIEMGTLFATQQSIRICESDPAPTYHGACAFPEGTDIHIAAANGHFHSRGKTFNIFKWDGTSEEQPPAADKFYTSADWSDPPMALGLDMQAPSGGGVWWTCSYEWQPPDEAAGGCDAVNKWDMDHGGAGTDCCYAFGPRVETNEHCNAFVYYYPRVARSDIFCN